MTSYQKRQDWHLRCGVINKWLQSRYRNWARCVNVDTPKMSKLRKATKNDEIDIGVINRWLQSRVEKFGRMTRTKPKVTEIWQDVSILISAVVGMFFPHRHVGIIWSRRRHGCRHNLSFKIEWNTRRKTAKTFFFSGYTCIGLHYISLP